MIRLVDAFHTIQGEGFNAGRRALFIRMPFCNLKCTWCDTSFNEYKEWTDEDLQRLIKSEPTRFAVITGGEPMTNKDTKHVVGELAKNWFNIACETNGNYPIVQGIDFVTVSPKRFAKEPYYVHPDAWIQADEFKYVVDDQFDFGVLKRHDHDLLDGRRYSLSPEFGQFKSNLARILAYTAKRPEWRVSLQTHKWMEVP